MKSLANLSLIKNIKIIGEGEQTLILCHGYGGSQNDWHKLIPCLSNNYQVLVFDWNFNSNIDNLSKYSSFIAFADDLISLIDDECNLELKGKPSVFIGHSMSAMIGCIACINRPQLFSQLIMIGASPRYINTEGYEGGFERERIDMLLSNMELNFQSWAENFIPHAIGVDDPLLIESFGKSFKSMNPDIAKTLAQTIFHSDMRDILDKVRAPCTIIQTTNDFVVPMFVGYFMQSKMKNSKTCTVETIEANGHLPQLTASQKVLEILHSVVLPLHEF